MQTYWLFRLTYLYLLIPFILFSLGWLRLIFAIPVIALIVWIFFQLDHSTESKPSSFILHPSRAAFILVFLWVFLSGVGGYAFQNWDHNWRNAVFRDLISYPLPVIYSSPEKGPVTMLVYYVGYWLPAVFAGKILGWKIANLILFAWTWLGVFLTVLHISLKIKTSAFKSALFFVFFSGMDALGGLFYAKDYPALFPPIQHLEIWSGILQYSSFTTQLFWVFNQSVPAWLCIALVLNSKRLDIKILSGALCFFFAPLAAVGLFPYLLIDGIDELRLNLKTFLKNIRYDVVCAGVVIVAISYLYFSSNTAAQERGFQSLVFKDVFIFFLLEGGILWLLLAPQRWRDPRWALTGILLFLMPFIQLGNGQDFVMRASIAPLFYLMLMSGEALFQKSQTRFYQAALLIVFFIGALTPLYEINRSAYRTFQYYFLLDASQRAAPRTEPATSIEKGGAPENEHPKAILADDVYSLAKLKDKLAKNFIANVRQSLYYRYLSPR